MLQRKHTWRIKSHASNTTLALLARVATEKARQARDLYDLQEADLQIKRALRYADEAGQPALSILPLYESGALLWEAGHPEKARTLFEKIVETQ